MENAPVYVKIDEYKEVLEIAGLLKDKLKEAKSILAKIDDLKKKEDAELDIWNNLVDEVGEKIDIIDRSLFEPEGV